MPITETSLDLSALSDADYRFIEQQARAWGVSFDTACLRLLLEESRRRRGLSVDPKPSAWQRLTRRFYGNPSAH